jgi:PST family polysaccharide transporter
VENFTLGGFGEVIAFLKKRLSNPFVRNMSWLGASQLFTRVIRLVTVVILGRILNPYDYGLAAVVLTTNEFVDVFTRNGVGAKLVQADSKDLDEFCQTGYWLNWLVFGLLFIIQCVAAFPVAWCYRDNQLILPICVLASIYLILPISQVQASLIQRENRLHIIAIITGLQNLIASIMSIILAFLGYGMWALVLPRLLVSPIWVLGCYIHHKWRPRKFFSLARWQEIVSFGQAILGVELLKTLRNNLDYLMVGYLIGIEPLGTYYFAFNAGLVLTLSVMTALDSALFPHLCNARTDLKQFRYRYFSSLKTIAIIIVPLVLLQSILAPVYVPIVYGHKWIPAIPILILICLSGITRPFANAASLSMWTLDKPHWDLAWNIFFTAIFALAIFIGSNWNILGVAAAVLIVHVTALPIYTLGVTRYVLRRAARQTQEV